MLGMFVPLRVGVALAIAALIRFAWVSCAAYQMAITPHTAATAPNDT